MGMRAYNVIVRGSFEKVVTVTPPDGDELTAMDIGEEMVCNYLKGLDLNADVDVLTTEVKDADD